MQLFSSWHISWSPREVHTQLCAFHFVCLGLVSLSRMLNKMASLVAWRTLKSNSASCTALTVSLPSLSRISLWTWYRDVSQGLGAFIAPLVATTFATKGKWYFHFLVCTVIAISNTAIITYVFRLKNRDGEFSSSISALFYWAITSLR